MAMLNAPPQKAFPGADVSAPSVAGDKWIDNSVAGNGLCEIALSVVPRMERLERRVETRRRLAENQTRVDLVVSETPGWCKESANF